MRCQLRRNIQVDVRGVNYMSNTFEGSLHCRRNLGSAGVTIWLLLVGIWLCTDLCTAKQTVLLPFLKTKNEKILLRMLHQTNYHVKYERFVDRTLMQCISPLKNDLTKSFTPRIIPLSSSLDYAKTLVLHSNAVQAGLSAGELEETRRVDLILDLLQGICLYYTTYTFIYEYCHKEHVRQFDDAITKTQNQKLHFQDISMGVYNPEGYTDRPTRLNIKPLTEEETASRIPETSQFTQQYHHLHVEDSDNGFDSIEFEEGPGGRTLHSNAHLASNKLLLLTPILLRITCEDHTSGEAVTVKNEAILATSFDLIYTKKNGKCDKYITYERMPTAKYFPDSYDPLTIKIMGSFIYGHVEERCTRNLQWERPGKKQKEHHLKAGSLLLLELYNFHSKSRQLHYVTVKQVFSGELIELENPLGKSFYTDQSEDKSYTDGIPSRLITNISKCQVLFEEPVNFQEATTGNKYLTSNTMKLSQTHTSNLEDARLACFCKVIKIDGTHVIDMEVKVGSKLWANHYTTYVQTNTHLLKEQLFKNCVEIGCAPFLQSTQQKKEETKGIKFTKIIRLNSANPELAFTSTNIDQIFVITIRKAGILRLITTDSEGNTYVYLLSEGQIIKMRQYSNGTKQIIKQNKYYENSTIPNEVSENNLIYLHITILPNGTHIGAIWKYKDYVQLPRFLFFNEKMSKFELIAGFADVRVLDTARMRGKDQLAVKQYIHLLSKHQFIKETTVQNEDESSEKKESLMLTRSHSINYTYTSGQYCGQPINKYRQTTATIKCGKPWFQITKLLQTSPCEYWLEIESSLLCDQTLKTVVEKDEEIPNKSKDDGIIFSGLMCLPAAGLYDEADHYIHFNPISQDDLQAAGYITKKRYNRK